MRNRYFSMGSILPLISVAFMLSFFTGCSVLSELAGHIPFFKSEQGKHSPGTDDFMKFISSVRSVGGDVESRYRLARHFQKRGRHNIALEELRAVVRMDPAHVKAYNAMGISHDRMEQFDLAVESYNRALEIDSELDHVHNNLGYSHLLMGNIGGAIISFKKAIALDKENERYHNNLALAYAREGLANMAFSEFKKAGDELTAQRNMMLLSTAPELPDDAKIRFARFSALYTTSAGKSGKEASVKHSPDRESNLGTTGTENPTMPAGNKNAGAADVNPIETPHNSLGEATTRKSSMGEMPPAHGVEIEISNGNGVKGMAGRVGEILGKKGYNVTLLTDAFQFNYPKTLIIFRSGHLKDAHLVAREFPGIDTTTCIMESRNLKREIKVLIGKDLLPYNRKLVGRDSIEFRFDIAHAD